MSKSLRIDIILNAADKVSQQVEGIIAQRLQTYIIK